MSERGKGNEEIHADHEAFMAAYTHARKELGKIPGVLGVGFGHIVTGGEYRVGLGFQVFVREKKDPAELSPAEIIPRTFEGYRIDVRAMQVMEPQAIRSIELEPVYLLGDDTHETVIRGGIQIEARRKDQPPKAPVKYAGTLGCIVKKRRGGSGDDNVYLLTCQHVLTNDAFGADANDICKEGDYVYHPYAEKTGTPKPGDFLGEIQFPLVKEEVMEGSGPYLDCGIARVDLGSTCCGSVCGTPKLQYEPKIKELGPDDASAAVKDWITDVRDLSKDPRIFSVVTVPRNADGQVTNDDTPLAAALAVIPANTERVRKVGRTTGRTVGIVVSVNTFGYTKKLNGDLLLIHDFIEILLDPAFDDGHGHGVGKNRIGRKSFAEDGDSGSIVVDKDNKAVGMVFGGPPAAQRQGSTYGVTWASHILPVLTALDVYIPTNPDNRGTHPGSDGAWAALYVPGDAPDKDEAKTLFSAGAALIAMPGANSAPPDLLGVGERFRATPVGAKLLDAFRTHQREVSCLVRGVRPVTVAWNRCKGPAFVAQTLNHLRGNSDHMPAEINGMRRRELLTRMRAVLMRHGGYSLQRALEEHGDALLALADAETFEECLDILRALEREDIPS